MKEKLFILLIAALFVAGCAAQEPLEWRCNAVDCIEYIGGVEWAEQNCFIDGNRTVCPVEFEGQRFLVPLEQFDLDSYVECTRYVCVEEVPYREADYEVDINTLIRR